uniref:Ig-like domain-containing protein n=1 Tax=Sphaeramia orbicularis TaxID=375764 RepID=A0A673B5Q6_9TELE
LAHGATRREELPIMRKAEVQMTLKKASPDQVVPDPRGSSHPSPTPPVFVRKMRNAAVGTGCDIRLKVTVAGDPQPSLYWYHNDDLLNMENQEYGGLWIRDCKPTDAGLYTCIANNHLGRKIQGFHWKNHKIQKEIL